MIYDPLSHSLTSPQTEAGGEQSDSCKHMSETRQNVHSRPYLPPTYLISDGREKATASCGSSKRSQNLISTDNVSLRYYAALPMGIPSPPCRTRLSLA